MEENSVSQISVEECSECGNPNLVFDHETGEIVCSLCGLVIEEQEIDRGPEWRAYTQREIEKKTRTGIPSALSICDKGLSTTFRPRDRDAFGRKLPVSTRIEMQKLRKLHIRSRMHTSEDRNLAKAMTELHRLSDKLKIFSESVREQAAFIYRRALKEGLIRGRSIASMIAASLYAACRMSRVPRTLKEIQEASEATGRYFKRKDVAQCYRLLLYKIGLKMPIPDSLDYLPKIAEELRISGKTQGLAIHILHRVRERGIHLGKDPRAIATAILYIACRQNGERITQRELAQVSRVTEVTVRNRAKEIIRKLGLSLES